MAPAWVKEYVEKHKLQAMFEEAANAVVKAKAPEPTSFLVEYFQKLHKKSQEALLEIPAEKKEGEAPAPAAPEAPA
eukprot:CAMPEP_0182615174 /NCGR_PEP_ID=MMETSP1330-20130603/33678_1 /TAXON_ID=464278 /ORGANISM="Picochlorum sp., Strain RCC944" /LENGTH=75 /DNA_ID=CAMNT_0024835071 /DNA_START=20 /DNA_END=244 /DNA_ORIENTATION=+